MSGHPVVSRRLDRDALVDVYGVDEDLVERARARERDTLRLAVSGKIAAGKDTVAPLALAEAGVDDVAHVRFAQPLKDELSEIVDEVAAASSLEQAARWVRERFAVPAEQARELAATLWPLVRMHDAAGRGRVLARLRWAVAVARRRAKPRRVVAATAAAWRESRVELTGWSRAPEARVAQQYLGTDVRRAQDELHWIRKALVLVLSAVADGRSVCVTDPRYPNEVEALRAAGFVVVRVDVDPEVQWARLRARDGTDPDPARLYHASETALDEYDAFDARFSNDGELGDTVARVAALLDAPPVAPRA